MKSFLFQGLQPFDERFYLYGFHSEMPVAVQFHERRGYVVAAFIVSFFLFALLEHEKFFIFFWKLHVAVKCRGRRGSGKPREERDSGICILLVWYRAARDTQRARGDSAAYGALCAV